MKKKLSRSGSGWALFMPKTLLELIDVNPETDYLEVKVENDTVKITKAENVTINNDTNQPKLNVYAIILVQ